MAHDYHEGYLTACSSLAITVGGGDTAPVLARTIHEHLTEGPRCEACENDVMRGRPDDPAEANLLMQYLTRRDNPEPPVPQPIDGEPSVEELIELICKKYGGRAPRVLLESFQAAMARKRDEEAA